MNLIILEIPVLEVKTQYPTRTNITLNYSILLDDARFSDHNHSYYLPARTIILNNGLDLLRMDWDTPEIKLLFTQEKIMKKYEGLKINKKIQKGLVERHALADKILDTTPIHLNKDSIKDSLRLIQLSKKLDNYETIVPHKLLDLYIKLRKDIERVKPIKDLNIAYINKGLAYQGTNTLAVKDGLRIKHFPDKGKYTFNNNFYSLGPLARISLELESLWNR